eukprot:TRINITY_DN3069_c0_g1_i1.p1 TRINITY_DN3069_c0_g1~~TRINITY_DN3069_c0_g1_i1.p1  ORF type:complete len:820 (+),score=150.91 TRINITY_DN3069_c0_g1_i1:799-3258(+)
MSLEASPEIIHFSGFQVGNYYKQNVSIVNNSHHRQRIQILEPTSSNFSLHTRLKTFIAPHLSQQITVIFKPTDYRYFYDCFRVKTETEELTVHIHGYPTTNSVDIPKRLDFGVVAVGTTADRTFDLTCSVPLDFEFRINMQPSPVFAISPMKGIIPANSSTTVTIKFTPVEYKTYHHSFSLETSEFNSVPTTIPLTGSCSPLDMPKLLLEQTRMEEELYRQDRLSSLLDIYDSLEDNSFEKSQTQVEIRRELGLTVLPKDSAIEKQHAYDLKRKHQEKLKAETMELHRTKKRMEKEAFEEEQRKLAEKQKLKTDFIAVDNSELCIAKDALLDFEKRFNEAVDLNNSIDNRVISRIGTPFIELDELEQLRQEEVQEQDQLMKELVIEGRETMHIEVSSVDRFANPHCELLLAHRFKINKENVQFSYLKRSEWERKIILRKRLREVINTLYYRHFIDQKISNLEAFFESIEDKGIDLKKVIQTAVNPINTSGSKTNRLQHTSMNKPATFINDNWNNEDSSQDSQLKLQKTLANLHSLNSLIKVKQPNCSWVEKKDPLISGYSAISHKDVSVLTNKLVSSHNPNYQDHEKLEIDYPRFLNLKRFDDFEPLILLPDKLNVDKLEISDQLSTFGYHPKLDAKIADISNFDVHQKNKKIIENNIFHLPSHDLLYGFKKNLTKEHDHDIFAPLRINKDLLFDITPSKDIRKPNLFNTENSLISIQKSDQYDSLPANLQNNISLFKNISNRNYLSKELFKEFDKEKFNDVPEFTEQGDIFPEWKFDEVPVIDQDIIANSKESVLSKLYLNQEINRVDRVNSVLNKYL